MTRNGCSTSGASAKPSPRPRYYEETERGQRALATRLPTFAAALATWDRRVAIGQRSFNVDDTADRTALRNGVLGSIKTALKNTSADGSRTIEIGTVGTLYHVAARITGEYDYEQRPWRRSATAQLRPQSIWDDIASVVAYAAPTWSLTDEPDNPPDILRSFDARWKSPTWITDLASQYGQRAAESGESRALELAIIARPFADQEALDSVTERVRELELALQSQPLPPVQSASEPTQGTSSAAQPAYAETAV